MKSSQNIINGPPLAREWKYKSAGEFLLQMISKHESGIALVQMESGEELTYSQILTKSLKLAISLKKLGLKLNDRVGFCSENNLNFAVAILANIFLGTTICPLNPFYTEREFIHSMTITKPKYIFLSSLTWSKMQKIMQNLPCRPKLVLLYSETSKPVIPNIPELISRTSDSELMNFKLPEIDIKDHVLLIACSSGTTGFPKGVMLTDKNVLAEIQCHDEDPISLYHNSKSILGLVPFFHGYGFFNLLMSLAFGTKLIVLSKFEERQFLEAVEKYKIETLTLVPPLMVFLAKSPIVDEYDLSSVKKIKSAAAPLSREIEEIIEKKFKLPFIHVGYGMTETSLSITLSPKNHKRNSVGVLLSGLKAKVVPLDGKSTEALGPNCEGELCFKGDIVMKGYCEDKEATKAVIDEDGFLHTGDVGYYDEDGYFYIVDRVKELIKYKGFQVPPAELEAILLSHPKIRDAAVVGLPDETAGELPLAFVVKQPGVEITAEEIIKYVNERVSPQKRLRGGIRFIEAIPKNTSGKILRRELRNLLKLKL